MRGLKLRPIVFFLIAVTGTAGAAPPIRHTGTTAHVMTSAQKLSLRNSLMALSRLPLPSYMAMSDAQKWAASPPMTFAPEQFSPVGRHKAIRFVPFTEAEVVKMAKQAKRYRAVGKVLTTSSSKSLPGEVQVHKHDFSKVAAKDWQSAPETSIWVGVAKYVEEINAFEKYLNRFGRSLREKGPTDMGVVAKAAYPTYSIPSTHVPGLGGFGSIPPRIPGDPNEGVELPDWELAADAGAFSWYLAQLQKKGIALQAKLLTTSELRRLVALGVTRNELAQAGVPASRMQTLSAGPADLCPVPQPVADTTPPPPPPPPARPTVPSWATADWQNLVNAYVAAATGLIADEQVMYQGTKYETDALNAAHLQLGDPVSFNISNAPSVINPADHAFRCDIGVCIEVLTDLHGGGLLNPQGYSISYKIFDHSGSYDLSQDGGALKLGPDAPSAPLDAEQQRILGNAGDMETGIAPTPDPTPPPPKVVKCLDEGILHHPEHSVAGGGYGGDIGPFGAHLDFGYGVASQVCNQGKTYDFDDSFGTSLDVVLFGAQLSIFNFSEDADCSSLLCQPELQQPTFTLLGTDVSGNVQKEKTIPGPGAVIAIGPIPLTIKSHMHYLMGLGGAPITHTPWPATCSAGSGQLGAGLQLRAEADIALEAALDVFVASAGIDATLVFVDDMLKASMTTTVTPSSNTVDYTPTIESDTKLLDGHIDAFVEVDLLLWSKKWSIELLNFAGFDGTINETIKVPSDYAQ